MLQHNTFVYTVLGARSAKSIQCDAYWYTQKYRNKSAII